jgi:hypothetical protein
VKLAKQVELSTGRSWKTVKAAKLHFSNLLYSKPIGEAFDGLDAVDIEAAYLAYCRATAWEIAANPEKLLSNLRKRSWFCITLLWHHVSRRIHWPFFHE